ncbi:hypothetical protein K469DRAFT_68166 [Zopfia rhizophila CBS 207.26]|uniref:Uncharacterized protein n=1 Tax=Zopfia rhizophila CBS 207.26 TaxID=1314779 RepID=A0A6A6D8F6_9PEZI|nr:hypothetical protein K469DRAFT_68166 [Zopfia rhizophila CBS 207.26]
MNLLSIRSFLLLFGFAFALLQALTIPQQHRSDLAQRDVKTLRDVNAVDLDRRASKPKSSKKADPPKSTKAPDPPKSDPPKSTKAPDPPKTSEPPKTSKTPDPPKSSHRPKTSSAKASNSTPTSKTASSTNIKSSVESTGAPSSVKSGDSASGSATTLSRLTITSLASSSASSSVPASCTKSGSFTLCASSSVLSSVSISLEVPRPTNAFNPCELPGVDCYGNFEGYNGVQDEETEWELYVKNSTRKFAKRGDRGYDPNIGAETIHIESLGYPAPGKLFTDSVAKKLSLQAHAYNFNTDKMDDFSVKDEKKSPSDTTGWVVEHIIELQTVKMFIESAAGTGEISLGSKVDSTFFKDWWNKNLDYNTFYSRPAGQANIPIANWKVPKPGSKQEDKWRTLNNLVFNSLGSAANRGDFVLCDATINGFKEKIWHGKNPMAENDFKKLSDEVATGAVTSNIHLSAIRTVLAVFKYFEDPTVKHNLQSAIKNVGTELSGSNINHLTGQNVDLAPLWKEFMEKKLAKIEEFGTGWVKKMIQYAEAGYDKEMKDLKAKETDLQKDEKLTGDAKNRAIQKKNQELARIQSEANSLKQKLHKADKDVDDAKDEVARLTKQYETDKKSSTEKARDNATKEQEAAEKRLYDAQKVYNLKLREGNKLDLKMVREMISNTKKDQDVLAKFKTYNNSFKMPKVA